MYVADKTVGFQELHLAPPSPLKDRTVITRTDLGSSWQLSVEDSSISSPATSTALLRIVVSK